MHGSLGEIDGGRAAAAARVRTARLALGCLLVYLVALSPHLVHHAFEKPTARPDCPFLTLSQHGDADAPQVPPAVAAIQPVSPLAAIPATLTLPSVLLPHLQPRAPPAAPLRSLSTWRFPVRLRTHPRRSHLSTWRRACDPSRFSPPAWPAHCSSP